MSITPLLASIAIGLRLGLLTAGEITSEPYRAARAIELFRTYRVPFAWGMVLPPSDDLTPFTTFGEDDEWVDPQAKILLTRYDNRCGVTDMLDLFDAVERMSFEVIAAEMVAVEFPILAAEDAVLDDWDLFRSWTMYERGDPRRWGVVLSRYEADGDRAQTSLGMSTSREVWSR